MDSAEVTLDAELQEIEIVFDRMDAADKNSRNTLVEMIQILKRTNENQDIVDEILPMTHFMLSTLEGIIEDNKDLKSTFTRAVEAKHEVLSKLDKLPQGSNKQQGIENGGMTSEIDQELLIATKQEIMEICKCEQEWFCKTRLFLERKIKLAQALEAVLSKLRINTRVDLSIMGRTL